MEIWEDIKENETVQKGLEFFKKYTNTKPVLETLKSEKAIQKVISVILRIFAVLFGLGLLLLWIRSWRFINQFKFFGGLGYLIWQLFFLFAGIFIVKIMYQRAVEITELPESDYVITPIIALILVTFGEVVFIFFAIMSLPAMLTIWFAGGALYSARGSLGMVLSYFDVLSPQNIFIGGISVFVLFWVVGFLTLIAARLFVETTLALVTVAKEASALRRHIVSEEE